ncbi:MAG: hypothetical protein RTV72_07425 [Candidatus Thorarchaeota archaeon]
MTEKEKFPLNSQSPLGRAMMFQALSAVLIIGGVYILFGAITTLNLWVLFIGSFYAIGFVQIFLVRYVLQKQLHGVKGSIGVAITTVVFSLFCFFNWLLQPLQEWKTIYFFTIATINFVILLKLKPLLFQD